MKSYFDEISVLQHWWKVVALRLHDGPDADHNLNAEIINFLHHSCKCMNTDKAMMINVDDLTLGIGPAGRVKAPVTKVHPVKVVNNNDGNRQAARQILLRNRN